MTDTPSDWLPRSSASGPPPAWPHSARPSPTGWKTWSTRRRTSSCGATISARSARARRSPTRTSSSSNATPTAAISPASDRWARCSAPSRRRWKTCSISRGCWRSARLTPSRKPRPCWPSSRRIHREEPDEKVIIFSEYSATVFWLAGFLGRHGYADRLLTFDGSLSAPERQQTLARFQSPEILLLISTDAASEGLNLQEQCRRVIHYELPFNPNRMLQRQGRVDRYGQERPCRFAFLYAKDTYEGEVLSRLFTKIETQITRLGAIGDVLGALQTDRIEQLLSRSPDDRDSGDRRRGAEHRRRTRRGSTTPTPGPCSATTR